MVTKQLTRKETAATEVLAFRVPTEFKDTLRLAASVRDGDNISRLIRRAVGRLIEEEQLLQGESADDRGVA